MRTLLLLATCVVLTLLLACSDDDCVTCPEVQPPVQQSFPVVGYLDAVLCEGFYVEDDHYVHSLTMRRDGSYLEFDSATTATYCTGTYELLDNELVMMPDDMDGCRVTWSCKVTVDSMVLCRCAGDYTPAWVFVRSTEN